MLLSAILALAAAQGAPSLLSSHDPETLVRFLQEEGYRAQLTRDRTGDPMIRSASGGTGFSIMFYGCKSNRQCADLQFQAAWDFEQGHPSAALINQWNAERRFTKAYLDKENDPVLEMDVLFTGGRMGREAFAEHLAAYTDGLAAFEKHVGWGEDAPEQTPAGSTDTTAR